MAIVKSRAILLKSYPFGESSEIAVLFTEKFGKIKLAARGTKRLKSRVRITPYTLFEVVFYMNPGKEIYNLREVHLLKTFQHSTDIEFQERVSKALNLIDAHLEEGPGSEPFFNLFVQFMDTLDKECSGDRLVLSFILKFLHLTGHSPILDRCVVCGAENDLIFFSPSEGGTVCSSCASRLQNGLLGFNEGIRKSLQFLLYKSFEAVAGIKLDLPAISRILREYVEFHLGATF